MTKKNKKDQKEKDEKFMRMALDQANLAFETGEIPIGVVLVHDEKVIMKSYNQVQLLNDVTAHAEIVAISSAGEYLQSKYLTDCTLYVSLEPCAMCAAAIGWAQISRLVVAAPDEQKGYRITAPNVLHPKCKVKFNIFAEESMRLLNQFFQQKREDRK